VRLDLPLFMATSIVLFLYFLVWIFMQERRIPFGRLILMPVLTIGIAPSIAISVLKGLFYRGGVFNRTPKFGIRGRQRLPILASLYRQQSLSYILMNTALFAYSMFPLIFVCQRGTWLAIPFVLLFPLGFLLMVWKDVIEFIRVDS
jgi:hypothetical protein